MIQIRSQIELDLALATSTFVLFIHSLLCETSLAVFREYEQWSSGNPGTKSGWIDADADPLLAQSASERTGIPSRSPQAVFLRRGRPAWTAEGLSITQASLRSAFGWPLLARG
jgi:bacillithiol system protein YtxJ